VLTTLGVAIACGSLVSMVAFALGMQRQAERPFTRLGLFNQIEVFPRKPEGTNRPPVLDDAALGRLAKLDGVAGAYPQLQVTGVKVRRGDREETAVALAVPRELALVGMIQEMLTAGRFFAADAPTEAEVIVSGPLAEELGFTNGVEAVDQTLQLEASGLTSAGAGRFEFERRLLAVRVIGVYSMPGMTPMFARRSVLLPVDLIKSIPGARFQAAVDQLKAGGDAADAGYGQVIVKAAHPREVARVKKAIEAMGYRTRALIDQLQEMRRFFIFLDLLLAAVGAVALVVASLGIVNTLLIAVLERTQEIGLCKALGASGGDLRILFLTEAAWVGLWGGVGGLLLGWTVAQVLNLAARVYTRHLGMPLEGSLFAFPPWLLIGTIFFAILVSMLAGVLPAGRAARVDPIRALRGL
jgi:putative ABC transport system permease protein